MYKRRSLVITVVQNAKYVFRDAAMLLFYIQQSNQHIVAHRAKFRTSVYNDFSITTTSEVWIPTI